MPFGHHARITVTNEGKQPIGDLYYNIDYRTYAHPLPAGTLYFHAQYRQAQPNHGWTNGLENAIGDAQINNKPNLTGDDNYVWMDAKGHGQFVGVTHVGPAEPGWLVGRRRRYVLHRRRKDALHRRHRDGGLFPGRLGFRRRAIFLSALWRAGGGRRKLAGSRSSVYRFHLDSPIPFSKSFKATIEHGHANVRSDNFYSVAYWYQGEAHAPYPPLPPVDDRLPELQPVGGPGNQGH